MKIDFTKELSKINYILSTIAESSYIIVKIKKDFKDKIKRELYLLNRIKMRIY